jgi:hypothetical protein
MEEKKSQYALNFGVIYDKFCNVCNGSMKLQIILAIWNTCENFKFNFNIVLNVGDTDITNNMQILYLFHIFSLI